MVIEAYRGAVATILISANREAVSQAGLAEDLASAAARRAKSAATHALGLDTDIDDDQPQAVLAGLMAARVLQRAMAATAAVRDDAHLADMAELVEQVLPALKSGDSSVRLAAERMVRPHVAPFDADPLFGRPLSTMLVCLRRTGEVLVTAYARLAAEVVRGVAGAGALDGDWLYAAWLDVVGPHFLTLTREAVDTRTTVAVDTVQLHLAQRKDVTAWAGTTRPTLNRWINDTQNNNTQNADQRIQET